MKNYLSIFSKANHLFRSSVIYRLVILFSRRDIKRLKILSVLQCALAFMDLIGVVMMGLLGALSVTGIQSKPTSRTVSRVLDLLNIENFSFQNQVAVIGVTSTMILVMRTVLSVILMKRTLLFLSRCGSNLSIKLIESYFDKSLTYIQNRSKQNFIFTATVGVNTLTLGILGSIINLSADLFTLSILLTALIFVNPLTTSAIFLLLGAIGFFLYLYTSKKGFKLGEKNAELSIRTNQGIEETFDLFRELTVRNQKKEFIERISHNKMKLADVIAETTMLPYQSKYIIETAIVIVATIVSGILFVIQDAYHAISMLTIFLAAGLRISPAILRIQQSALNLRQSRGIAGPTLELIEELDNTSVSRNISIEQRELNGNFTSTIELKEITFRYPNSNINVLSDLNLKISGKKLVALVGPSGSGKTTLVDLILGLIEPISGSIKISGEPPKKAINQWPGFISYVPQEVFIVDGTVIENITLKKAYSILDEQKAIEALNKASLITFVHNLPEGLHTKLGENGIRLSGGQKQRIGLARAFFTDPRFIVLDEATSALDGSTEMDITDNLNKLSGKCLVLVIAHRLSTVINAELVIYMENGKISSMGTFDEVRKESPNFDKQANLMGLKQ